MTSTGARAMAERQHEHTDRSASTTGAGTRDGADSRAHLQQLLARVREAMRGSGSAIGDGDASARARRDAHALRAELRTSVGAHARRLRGEGLPPERMLVLLKEAVRDATLAELPSHRAKELLDDVVRWSVAAYYDA